ncbi:hypothetical protein CAEBREN_28201 [Caenorhabditis brenneri]|uniref:G-protein coupled receptors family 1 profile domain-containing protein n=1 Tax=Caenorhabditis brenneri TaxID=135651 RepID=G0MT60_CAEBE|nr:hypothetical protein CAEBREN_28201 [Caenorhabditis brenneri]
MFINWAHCLIPKAFFILSIITNQVFISLVKTERDFHFGNYKYLLYFLAMFDIIASLTDLLIPVCIHTYRSAIVVFIVNGFYSDKSITNESCIAFRLAFIGGTYAILNSHFIFRYLSLRQNYYVSKYFYPYGLHSSVCFVSMHIFLWFCVTDKTMTSNDEAKEYMRGSFEQSFGNMENINMKIWIFSDAGIGYQNLQNTIKNLDWSSLTAEILKRIETQ